MLALIEMNLLPGGRRGVARPKGRRKLSLPKFAGLRDMIKGDPWVIGVVAVAGAAAAHLLLTFFSQSVTLNRLNDELEVQRQDSIRYAESIAAADSLEARRDTLQAKTQIIREIDQDRFVWAHIMDDVSQALPDYTWLTSLRQTAGVGSDIEFRIDGLTGATQALTRFMRNLEESPFVRDVRLVSQEQIQQGQRLVHNFVLLARYQLPDSSVIITEPIILAGE
ncbi:MAG: PilN domain-containing protein [Gemmatimonadota bacterium]|nr:MAG: PilN domain-containing protein [Gemmatimonadota bacterium]